MKKEIELDAEFKIIKCGDSFTLMNLTEITSGNRAGESTWKPHGYHGSMLSAMRGYIRHSMDACDTVKDIVERLEVLENKYIGKKEKIRSKK